MIGSTLKALAALFGLLPGWLWASLVAAMAMHGCWVGHQRDSARNDLQALQTKVAKVDLERAKVALEANSNFRKFEHLQAATAAEIENANQKRKAAAQPVAAGNRALAGSVRLDVERLNAIARAGFLPSSAADAGELAASRRAAEVARGLFATCTAEYADLASAAQLDVIDLGTAVEFVDLVQMAAPTK